MTGRAEGILLKPAVNTVIFWFSAQPGRHRRHRSSEAALEGKPIILTVFSFPYVEHMSRDGVQISPPPPYFSAQFAYFHPEL